MKPKLLVISYWFPPFQAMGTYRVASFVRAFADAGWHVAVVAPRDSVWAHYGLRGVPVPDCELCRTPAASWAVVLRRLSLGTLKGGAQTTGGQNVGGGRLKRFLYSLYNNWLCYPDECRPWLWFGMRKAVRFGVTFRPDAILSSAMPASAHVIAARIQSELNVPWIADYRDLWTRHETRPRPRRHERRFQELEDKTIRNASVLTTVSRQYARVLETNTGKSCRIVYNGFEPSDLPMRSLRQPNQFTILYTGMIYPDQQHPERFLHGLKQFVDAEQLSPEQVRFVYMGASDETVHDLAAVTATQPFCDIRCSQPRQDALHHQQEASVLLFLACDTTGWIPGKLFEYLANGKPILSVGARNEEIGELLDLCPRSEHCPDAEAVSRVLRAYWQAWRIKRSAGDCCSVRLGDFTRGAQARKMIELADNLR